MDRYPLGSRPAGGIGLVSEPARLDPARASRSLLTRIQELHTAGRNAEEIAALVLTTEPENLAFRGGVLVEIILHQLQGGRERMNP